MVQLRLAALGLVAALTACTGTVINPYYYAGFEPTEAYRVGILTSGEPLPGTRPEVPQAVLAAMQGHTAFPTDFTLLPDGGYADYRAVLMFDPPRGLPNFMLCAGPPPPQGMTPPAPDNPRLAFSAALCRGVQVLVSAYGYMDRVPPSDPRFADAVAEVTRNLFPPNNPEWHPVHHRKMALR
jgi:hypothetical protein